MFNRSQLFSVLKEMLNIKYVDEAFIIKMRRGKWMRKATNLPFYYQFIIDEEMYGKQTKEKEAKWFYLHGFSSVSVSPILFPTH